MNLFYGFVLACLWIPIASFASSLPYSIDVPKFKQLLMDIMKCQGVRQLHVAAVHKDEELFSIRLDTSPDGNIIDADQSKMLMIASVSKGMFATALDVIRKELLSLDANFDLFSTPLYQIFGPDFWFLDEERTKLLTIDDILSHSTGLRRHDIMWYVSSNRTKMDIFRDTTRLKPAKSFRGSFLYNNLVWTIADLAVEKSLRNKRMLNGTDIGDGFVKYMRKYLWSKLGMNDTKSVSEFQYKNKSINTEKLYKNVFKQADNTEYDTLQLQSNAVNVESAGGVVLTLNDMIKYMKYQLKNVHFSMLWPTTSYFEPMNARAPSPFVLFYPGYFHDNVTNIPELLVDSYTRGWSKSRYRNQLTYNHGGTLFGARCQIELFPSQNLSLFTHVNLGGNLQDYPFSGFYSFYIAYYMFDILTKNVSFMTDENKCNMFKPISQKIDSIKRKDLTNDELMKYVGSYGQYGFGMVNVFINRTINLLSFTYLSAQAELYAVSTPQSSDNVEVFFLKMIKPIENTLGFDSVILNLTDSAIYAYNNSLEADMYYAKFYKDDKGDMYLHAIILEEDLSLKRGLNPATWTRPEKCPTDNKLSIRLVAVDISKLLFYSVFLFVALNIY